MLTQLFILHKLAPIVCTCNLCNEVYITKNYLGKQDFDACLDHEVALLEME